MEGNLLLICSWTNLAISNLINLLKEYVSCAYFAVFELYIPDSVYVFRYNLMTKQLLVRFAYL